MKIDDDGEENKQIFINLIKYEESYTRFLV